MKRIRETIIVEGRYDVNTLKQCVDAHVIETSGFVLVLPLPGHAVSR